VEQRPRAHEGDIFNASTDEEGEGVDELPDLDTPPARRVEDNEDDLPVLPDFFGGKIFFLYGTFGTDERRSIIRYIVAYGGYVLCTMCTEGMYYVLCVRRVCTMYYVYEGYVLCVRRVCTMCTKGMYYVLCVRRVCTMYYVYGGYVLCVRRVCTM